MLKNTILLFISLLVGACGSIASSNRMTGSEGRTPAAISSGNAETVLLGGVAAGTNSGTIFSGGLSPGPSSPSVTLISGNAAGSFAVPLQRLTQQQYISSVQDLLALATAPNPTLPADDLAGPFAANTVTLATDLSTGQYEAAATQIAAAAAANLGTLLPCPQSGVTAACISQFIQTFGTAAFRRPLTADEITRYNALAASYQSTTGSTVALQEVISSFLQSPNFIYRAELGGAGDAATGAPLTLTSYELGSRLSYALWNTTPDSQMLADAASGALTTPAGVAAAAQRLMASPRYGANQANFITTLLDIPAGNAPPSKDATAFPNFTPALYQAMVQETTDFATYVYTTGDGRMDTLYTAPFSLLTDPMFSFYGITKPSGWTAGQPVQMGTQRAGLLTQASFLAAQAHATATSPVFRGKILRENLLCQMMPNPPPGTPALSAINPAGKTAKQVMTLHEANPTCASCHLLMDPMGLAFEHYDATGAWRGNDKGLTIDPSGSFATVTASAATAFTDNFTLAQDLAANPDAQTCLVLQTFRYAMQRPQMPSDAAQLASFNAVFKASNHDLRATTLAMVTAPAFTTMVPGATVVVPKAATAVVTQPTLSSGHLYVPTGDTCIFGNTSGTSATGQAAYSAACNSTSDGHGLWTYIGGQLLNGTGQCLDTQGKAAAAKTATVLAPCDGSASQQWTVKATTLGTGTVVNKASSLCLEVAASTAPTATAQIDTCATSAAETFLWAPVSVTSPGGFMTMLSPDGVYRMTAQSDGNLVEYIGADPVFSSGTYNKGKGPFEVQVQSDGNFVLYDVTGAPIYDTVTYGVGTGPYVYAAADGGDFTLIDATGKVLFSTGG